MDFYNKMREGLDIEAPRAYYARNDPESMNSIIVMREMPESQFFHDDAKVDRERASLMITVLTKLHGTFYDPASVAAVGPRFANFADYWAKIEMMGMKE